MKTGKSTGCRARFWKRSFLAVKLTLIFFIASCFSGALPALDNATLKFTGNLNICGYCISSPAAGLQLRSFAFLGFAAQLFCSRFVRISSPGVRNGGPSVSAYL